MTRMRCWILGVLVAGSPIGMVDPAAAKTTRFTHDVVGDVITCETGTYTVVSGYLDIVLHEGDSSFSARARPEDVTVEDEAGEVYEIHGVVRSGGSLNYQQKTGEETFTFQVGIVGDDGLVGRVSITAHFSDGGANFFIDRGPCREP